MTTPRFLAGSHVEGIVPAAPRPVVRGLPAWQRPLLVLAATMAVSTCACLVGMLIDHRTLTGMPLWDKPFKFSVSATLYCLTWSWLIPQLQRARRLAWWAGTVSAVGLAAEMAVVLLQAGRDTTSHFNVSTPLNAALWSAMGVTIVFIWVATFVVTLLLFAGQGADRARHYAVRCGAVIAMIGMSLGFLMTIPSKAQIAADDGILGAHTVGLADGGPGLPILGWSTVGGDLRIPHFLGMHALQLIPLLLLTLEIAGRRGGRLADTAIRARLVLVAAAALLAMVGLVTWQALRGQSVVHPDLWTLAALTGIVALTSLGTAVALRTPRNVRSVR